MRIMILNITSGGMSDGYKKFLKNIIPRVSSHSSVSEIHVSVPKGVDLSDLNKSYPDIRWHNFNHHILSGPGTHRTIKKTLEVISPDVVFIPTARYMKIKEIPVVMMIQNMEPLAYESANPVSERFINWMRAREARKSLSISTRVIAISRFVKKILIEKYSVAPEKIVLDYFGADTMNGPVSKKPPILPDSWKGKFLFTAGSIRPARGMEDLCSLLQNINNRPDISGVVIAGETSDRMMSYRNHVISIIKNQGLSSKVCWTGHLSDSEMSWCYQNCYAFVMTSRVEACPNIALEALSHGCICISSDNSPMPEIFGDAAIYYSAGSSYSLAKSTETVLSWDMSKGRKASDMAKKRALKFSWDVCADRIVTELRYAVELYCSKKPR